MLGADDRVLSFVFQMMLAGAGIGFVMHVGADAFGALKGTLRSYFWTAFVGILGSAASYASLVLFADTSIVPCSYFSKSPLYLGAWSGLLASFYYLGMKTSTPAYRVRFTVGFILGLATIIWLFDC